MGGDLGGGEMSIGFAQTWGSALLAGVLSSCFAKKKVAKEEGDPEVGAGFAGPLRYSAGRAAAELGLRPQTVLADCPRPSCVAQRLPRGPEKRPRLSVVPKKMGFHGQPERRAKFEIHCSSVDASLGPLRGAEQCRGWRIKGEDCLRAKPEFRSPRQSRVAQGTGEAGTDPGSPSSLATFFLAKQEESTPASKAETQANPGRSAKNQETPC
jgi:hypothetical protein